MNLAPDTEAHDLHQQLDIALVFAQRGGIRAREAIYARFAASVADDDDLGLRAVVRLDGASGLAYAIGALEPHIGDYVGTEAEELRELAEERSGEAETERLLKEVAAANPALQSFVKSALRRRHPAAAPSEAAKARSIQRQRRPHPGPLDSLRYAELKEGLVTGTKGYSRANLERWGRAASEEDVLRAALDLASTTDPKQLLRYVYLFIRRPFPLDPTPLIQLMKSDDFEVTWPTAQALARLKHPDVRQLALRSIGLADTAAWAVALLLENLAPGDERQVEAGLRLPFTHDFDRHAYGMELLKIGERYGWAATTRALFTLYETGLCSNCRGRVLKQLEGRGELSEALITEALHDSAEDTRKWARDVIVERRSA